MSARILLMLMFFCWNNDGLPNAQSSTSRIRTFCRNFYQKSYRCSWNKLWFSTKFILQWIYFSLFFTEFCIKTFLSDYQILEPKTKKILFIQKLSKLVSMLSLTLGQISKTYY